ncbi:MAG: beta-lactamase family protein [bacterium]|nr:beta-lactamase family protein [bacterium]
MKRMTCVFLCLVFCVITGTSQAAPYSFQDLVDDLQINVVELRKKTGAPGVTATIILPEGQTIALTSGLADIEEKKLMAPHHRIFLGSVGKTFVAAIVMKMVAEKKIGLHDKISRYLGKEKWFSQLPNSAELTVSMLLSHTGGLPRYVDDKFFAVLFKDPFKVWKPVELLSFILGDKPVHPAGKGWNYSDTDYILLGMIIERVSGKSYYYELNRRILTPHKLTDILPADKPDLKGLIPCYTGNKLPPPFKVVVNGSCLVSPQFEWTGGGLYCTSEHLARFFKLLLEGKIVSPKCLELMKTAHDEKTGELAETGYGFGLEVLKTMDGIIYGHRGTMLGCRTIAQYVPKYGYAIVLQINADHEYGKLDKSISRFDYIAPLKALVGKYLKTGAFVKSI